MALRIEGLVRFHDRVRTLLARGVEGKERDDLPGLVRRTLRSVEEICARHGTTPASLPGPSRNAYRALAAIDLEHLPAPRTGEPQPPRRLRLTGIVKTAGWLGRRLWRERIRLLGSEHDLTLFAGEISRHVREIEELCRSEGGHPSDLPAPTRLLYAWMRFVADEAVLARHLAALGRAAAETGSLPIEVHLVGSRSLWRRNVRPAFTLFTASEGYLDAPADVWRGLVAVARGDGRGPAGGEEVRRWALSPEFARVVREMEAAVGGADRSRGRHHDLEASFERVNTALFAGRVPRPALCFGRIATSRKLAHYEPSHHRVLFSSLLDDPAVSELVIDCLMHHELLHIVFGIEERNGRHVAHGPEFRRAELLFPGREEAQRQIADFLSCRASRVSCTW